jgi:hypothetical protein
MPGSGGGREPREPVCPRSCIGVKLRAASGPAICIPRNLGQPRTVQSHTTHTAQTTSTVRRWSYHGAAHTHTAGRGRALPPGRRLRRMGRLALCVGRQRGRRARLAPLARRRARDVGGDVAFSSSRAVLARHRGCSRRRRYGVARGLGARCRGRCSGPASTWADGAGRPPAAICNPGYGPVHSGCNSMCEPRWLGLMRAGDGPRQRGCSRASRGRGRHPRA